MTKELEHLQYNDVLTDLASSMETVGARKFLQDFKSCYPRHFEEIQIQITRLDQRTPCKLLTKDE
jgi:hypothetical protein